MQISSALTRRWALLALVALLGLSVTFATSASSASSGHAVIAKKKHKCKKKKKGKKSATAAKKKKKCKKKVHHVVLPAPGPLVRGTLAWSADDEVDLHAFDASGNHAGWDNNLLPNPGVVNNIPSAHHNGDVGPGGPSESFTDDIFVVGGPSNREFSFVACLYNDGGDYGADFTGVTKDGTSSSLHLDGPGIYTLSVPGGPSVPDAAQVCDVAI